MKLLLLPKYSPTGPSSRYRTYLYIPYIKSKYLLTIAPLFNDEYYAKRFTLNDKFYLILLLIKHVLARLTFLFINIHRYDALFIEKELFPYFPYFLEKIILNRIKYYILDYDDAIFHNYDSGNRIKTFILKNKIKKLIKNANYVITGSPYLTNYCLNYNINVIEIPTSLNISKYYVTDFKLKSNGFVISWIGSKTTSKYIIDIVPYLYSVQQKYPDIVYKFIGFDKELEYKIVKLNYILIEWNNETEVEELSISHVGIMPLDYSNFSKGKCGFKLVQYMACGLPFIATPLEANLKIDLNKQNLFAKDSLDWFFCIEEIYINYEQVFLNVGKNNRTLAEQYYSDQINKNKILEILNKMNL